MRLRTKLNDGSGPDQARDEHHQRRGEQVAIEAIEHAAVAGHDAANERALDPRLLE